VDSCVRFGTDYCDITAEFNFVRKVIDRYDQKAKQSGSLIVHACGFDSIPSDLGTYLAVEHMKSRFKKNCGQVKIFQEVTGLNLSGGTYASLMAIFDSESFREYPRLLTDSYYLCEKKGNDKESFLPGYDNEYKWTAPFIMAPIDSKVVRRSNSLLHYGNDFRIKEMVGNLSFFKAVLSSFLMIMGILLFILRPTRAIIRGFLPKSGQGPTKEQMEKSSFRTNVIAETEDRAEKVKVVIEGYKDARYAETSKMIAECGLSMAFQRNQLPGKMGGVLTPASGFGSVLVERLRNAGIKLQVQGEIRQAE